MKQDKIIIEGPEPFVWVVTDNKYHNFWLFYDRDNANKFMFEMEDKNGNYYTLSQQYILDMKTE